jgi:Leucine-rich repeat (LRR) protein
LRQSLIGSHNQLEAIPDQFYDLPLVELDLSNNRIVNLWEDIARWTRMEKLLLNGNRIELLPVAIT